jgi:hypothetical protein
MIDTGPVAAGWCAPADTAYLPEPGPPATWLVDLDALAALTDDDKGWLDEQWAIGEVTP